MSWSVSCFYVLSAYPRSYNSDHTNILVIFSQERGETVVSGWNSWSFRFFEILLGRSRGFYRRKFCACENAEPSNRLPRWQDAVAGSLRD